MAVMRIVVRRDGDRVIGTCYIGENENTMGQAGELWMRTALWSAFQDTLMHGVARGYGDTLESLTVVPWNVPEGVPATATRGAA